jgi:hypothetical protein
MEARLFAAMEAFYAKCCAMEGVSQAARRVRARIEQDEAEGRPPWPLLTPTEARHLEAGFRDAVARAQARATAAAAARLAQLQGDPVLRAKVFGNLRQLYAQKGFMSARARGGLLHNVFQYLLAGQAAGVGGAEMMAAWRSALAGARPGDFDADADAALREAVLQSLERASVQATLANAIQFVESCVQLSPKAKEDCVRAWRLARDDLELLDQLYQATSSSTDY